jgi:hypothetical protein
LIEYACNNNVWVNIIPVCAQAVLGGSDAETLGGNTSFQSGASGGPAASTPAQDGGASAAEAAVQRASDAVKQLQQNTANLGRRLLRA